MKYLRVRTALALVIAVPLWIVVTTGCATARHDPLYDGEITPEAPSADSITFVPVRIQNSRSSPTEISNPPMFFLLGNGKHQLARVEGLSSRTVFVDSRWLTSADGEITIVVHYAGGAELTYARFAWHPGQTISVSLEVTFNPISAWSR